MTLEDVKRLLEKATKGPWFDDDAELEVWGEDGSWIADTGDSNAALIAAAPELAALLVRAVEALEDQIERDGICLVDPPCGDCAACRARAILRELGVEA